MFMVKMSDSPSYVRVSLSTPRVHAVRRTVPALRPVRHTAHGMLAAAAAR